MLLDSESNKISHMPLFQKPILSTHLRELMGILTAQGLHTRVSDLKLEFHEAHLITGSVSETLCPITCVCSSSCCCSGGLLTFSMSVTKSWPRVLFFFLPGMVPCNVKITPGRPTRCTRTCLHAAGSAEVLLHPQQSKRREFSSGSVPVATLILFPFSWVTP